MRTAEVVVQALKYWHFVSMIPLGWSILARATRRCCRFPTTMNERSGRLGALISYLSAQAGGNGPVPLIFRSAIRSSWCGWAILVFEAAGVHSRPGSAKERPEWAQGYCLGRWSGMSQTTRGMGPPFSWGRYCKLKKDDSLTWLKKHHATASHLGVAGCLLVKMPPSDQRVLALSKLSKRCDDVQATQLGHLEIVPGLSTSHHHQPQTLVPGRCSAFHSSGPCIRHYSSSFPPQQ